MICAALMRTTSCDHLATRPLCAPIPPRGRDLGLYSRRHRGSILIAETNSKERRIMMHSQRMFPYLIGAAGLSAVLIAFGAPLATVLPFAIFLACPLMMFLMMRGMAGTKGREDHTGHGCGHDPTRQDHHAEPRS